MLFTKEERLEMAREVLQNLNHDLIAPPGSDTNSLTGYLEPTIPRTPYPIINPLPIRQRGSTIEILNKIGPLPSRTTYLGICDDGLPLLFDLSDPSPGAILISGRRQTGKTRLLKTILTATCLINSIDDFCFYTISPKPEQYRELYGMEHCIDLVSSYDRAAIEIVVNLAGITEQRRSGRFIGPVTILAIDDLQELVRTEEFELTNHLRWLLTHGPKNGIWPIATVQHESINSMNPRILSNFKTNLTALDGVYQLSQGRSLLSEGPLNPFTARVGPQCINFWIPDLL